MKFSAPKRITWWIAVVVGAVGVLAKVVSVPFPIPLLSQYPGWLVAFGFVLLAVATVVERL